MGVMLSNSSYHLHWGERGLDFLILSYIDWGVADVQYCIESSLKSGRYHEAPPQ